jgi:thioredoxin 1
MFTRKMLFLIILVAVLFIKLNGQSKSKSEIKTEVKPKVTFIELGSVNCIPCKAMQPIMKSVEKKYGEQLKVIFYDVWKEDQQQYAEKYGIRLIPTQVFLDDRGKEIFRHEGFFAEGELDKFLQSKGLKINVLDEKK